MIWQQIDALKLVFIIMVFAEALFGGLVPVKLKTFSKSPKILGVANSFSGGIFLAIALLHIMPE